MTYADETEIPTLQIALESMTADELRKLAALTGVKPPTRKAEIAAVIIQHLAGPRLRTVWEGLDELQRAAVAEAVHSPSPQFKPEQFRAKYGRDPNWGSKDKHGYSFNPSPLCFFFPRNGVIPRDLQARLLTFVPAPPQPAIATLDQLPPFLEDSFEQWDQERRTRETVTEQIPITIHENEQSAIRELISVLRLADAGKISVSDKTRRASASTIAAITAILHRGDYYPYVKPENEWDDENAGPIRAFAWPLLIQAGGLAEVSGTRLQLTKAGRKALSEPAAQTIRRLWEKWIDTTILDEFARIDCVKGQTGNGKRGLTAVRSRREVIADALAECPAGKWVAIDEFLRYMRATEKDFDVSPNLRGLYICEPRYGSLDYGNATDILNDRYLMALLLEYAATLGMIDVALIPPAEARPDYGDLWGTDGLPFFSRYDGLLYLRLTRLGAYCLDEAPDYQPATPEVKPVLRVLPNLEIVATDADLDRSDRLALDAYATPVSDLVWRLEFGKLLAAIEAGRQVEEIRGFLAARSGTALPDTVTRLLDDIAERTTRVRDRGLARLIECADAALAALIANDTRTRKYCLPAGERRLVVEASAEAAFRRALRDAGYLLAEPDIGLKTEGRRPKDRRAKPKAAGE